MKDAIKDLSKDVIDVIANLCDKMSNIATLVKVLMFAIGNSSWILKVKKEGEDPQIKALCKREGCAKAGEFYV